jgi:ribonuclease D
MNESQRVGDAMVVRGDLPERLVAAYRSAGKLAWDTETSGLDAAADMLQLCQLSARGVGTTLVQLGPDRPTGLMDLLSDDSVRVVMHHAPFDLLFMRRAWGVRASNIRCTKIASKLLSPDAPSAAHSLAALARDRLDVTLRKGAVRTSDWASATLSPEQVDYAANDVLHLLDLYDGLLEDMESARLTRLYEACCDFLPVRTEVAARGTQDVFAY